MTPTSPPHTPPNEQLTRRKLTKTVTWATPTVVASFAAPAYASSPCTNRSLVWADSLVNAAAPSPVVVGPTSDPVNVSHTVSPASGTTLGPQANFIQAGPQSNVAGNWWRLSMGSRSVASQSGWSVSSRWTFSRPVSNLKFSILDIDYLTGAGGWSDGVSLTSPSSYSQVKGSMIDGTGAPGSEWYARDSFNGGASDAGYRVDITFPGPVSEFTIRYISGNRSSGTANMHIGLSGMTFCA